MTPRWRDLYTWQPGTRDKQLHLIRLFVSTPDEPMPSLAMCLRSWSYVVPDEDRQKIAERRRCRECLLVVATELSRATTAIGMNVAMKIVAEAHRIGGE